MRCATNSEEFIAAPVGSYFAGHRWLFWCTDSTLCGSALWGRLEEADIIEVLVPFESLFSPQMAVPCGVLTDASRLEGIDPAAFARFAEFIRRRLPDLERQMGRHAMVRPPGMLGTVITGGYEVIGRPSYPVATFLESAAALQWLGRQDATALAAELSALVDAAAAVPDAVQALRRLLATRLDVGLAGAARALGASQRSLQRQLQTAGTSFRAEVDRARIRAAATLLADTDRKITAIALDVGCATLQHFSALFRRLTGETPSGWRARQQRGAFS
jgi:AraC-like DNA-binding protein